MLLLRDNMLLLSTMHSAFVLCLYLDIVWEVVERDLPGLKASIDALLNTGETTE